MNQISAGRPITKRTHFERARAILNLFTGKQVVAKFEITLICNSACGYCDLNGRTKAWEKDRAFVRLFYYCIIILLYYYIVILIYYYIIILSYYHIIILL